MSQEQYPYQHLLQQLGGDALGDPHVTATYLQFAKAEATHNQPFKITKQQWRIAAGVGACAIVWAFNAMLHIDGPVKPLDAGTPRPSATATQQPETQYQPTYGKSGGIHVGG
jgi:hypothetical protein